MQKLRLKEQRKILKEQTNFKTKGKQDKLQNNVSNKKRTKVDLE